MVYMTTLVVALAPAVYLAASVHDNEMVLESFDGGAVPGNLTPHNVEVELVERGLEVRFEVVDWPNVFFTPPDGVWNWEAYVGVAVDIYNPESGPVDVCMRVDDDPRADGISHCNTGSAVALPGVVTTLEVRFRSNDAGPFWGMRGVPVRGPLGHGTPIDPNHIVAYQVFLPRPHREHTLILERVRLFGKGGPLEDLVPLPFVDRFGQYKHADWPGKLKDEREFETRRRHEEQAIRAAPRLAGRDQFGGWADGPQLEATGWFRTDQLDGKWWLVTPEGHLFFSLGIDCVGTWEQTFVEGREGWFEWLPDPEGGNPFKGLYGHAAGAHSMADTINGEGRTFSFYRGNLIRKYGDDWPDRWRESAYARLSAWGFNTIANWSQRDVLENSPMPFTATTGIRGDFRRIEAGGGYWAKLMDVFDPKFGEAAESCVAPEAKRFADNPRCIGYYVDNELAWGGIKKGVLASPPDQPCRMAFVEQLKAKYGMLERLNEAWGTDAVDWDGLRPPQVVNAAYTADLDAFVYAFARRYFETIRDALKRHAPNQLYLGCRFAGPPDAPVIRACADVADVLSFNLYYRTINPVNWTVENDLGKPIIIGEFHFGALDGGMFHTGLVATRNQQDRAESYARYVRSVVDCSAFVGCHWFQYVDEPITGRWFDGENYNIGFVTVVDSPYPELVDAAKKIHQEVYPRRYRGPKN